MNYAALFSWQATAGCSPPPVCRLRHQLFVPLVALYKHASEGGKKPLFSRTFFSNGDTSPLGYSANTKSSIGWDGTGDGPLLLLHLNGQREKTEGLVPTDIIECLCALFSLVGRREAPHYSFSSSPFFAHSHCRRIAVRCNPNTPTMSAEGGDRSGTKQRLCSRKEALRQTHSGNSLFRGIRVRYSRFLFFLRSGIRGATEE